MYLSLLWNTLYVHYVNYVKQIHAHLTLYMYVVSFIIKLHCYYITFPVWQSIFMFTAKQI